MRIPSSALVAAALFAASILPAGASVLQPGLHQGQRLSPAQVAQLRNPNALAPNPHAIRAFHKPVFSRFNPNVATKLLVSDDEWGVWLLGANGTTTNGLLSDCSGAEGMKVDRHKNLIVACTNTGTVNIYTPAQYAGAGSPSTDVLNDCYIDQYGYNACPYLADVTVDHNGDVWASSLYGFDAYDNFLYGQIFYWAHGNTANGASPTSTVADPNLYEGFFLDVDKTGSNLYVDYYSIVNFEYNIDWINLAGGGTVTTIGAPYDLEFPGGVNVSYATQNVNVMDQDLREIINFLPGAGGPSGGPFGGYGYGPAAENFPNTCYDPVAMTANKNDVEFNMGLDGCDASGTIKEGTNVAAGVGNWNLQLPIDASETSSDKN
jgi:hypothetical protein